MTIKGAKDNPKHIGSGSVTFQLSTVLIYYVCSIFYLDVASFLPGNSSYAHFIHVC